MSWYESFFEDEGWLYVQRNIRSRDQSATEAEQLIRLLGLTAGDAVLDVPCGDGRIALELASHGMSVTGVDRTSQLLADARSGAAARSVQIELRQSDMRDLPWENRFDAAINLWGSFGYFDETGNAAFATAVCRTLRPGGVFIIDGNSVETLAPTYQARGWQRVGEAMVLEDRVYRFANGMVDVTWTFIRGEHQSTVQSSIRIYSAPELTQLLRNAGFSSVETFGSLEGTPFGFGKRLITVARR